ncbi:MAG: cytochrome c biogenesis protein ResB [Blautia sp.]|nr:cytochrome c biogenesis protein ResB [Blautia sp.]
MKKHLRFFFSMKFAIVILLVLVGACTVGSVIPQGNTMAWYAQNYSERVAGAVMLFGLDDVFHSPWFVILTLVLCGNLLGCNLLHLPQLIRRMKKGFQPDPDTMVAVSVIGRTQNAAEVFHSLGFRRIEERKTKDGSAFLYSVKNKAGIWGAWICHLGMLVVIIGFGLGQAFKTEDTVYGVTGQTKPVGETRYALTIDDFTVDLREDDTVSQYLSTLTMTDTVTGESQSGQTSVNAPLTLFGRRLYQNSTGWAAETVIEKNGEEIQSQILCAGEYMPIEDFPDLVVTLAAFYPDYQPDEKGHPQTASGRILNPAYLYRIYYREQVLGMNVLLGDEVITVEDYTIRFRNPQSYTLIQVKRDPFTPIAAIGGALVLVGLILAFYLRTAELWAVQALDGSWQLGGRSKKGGAEFEEAVGEKCLLYREVIE